MNKTPIPRKLNDGMIEALSGYVAKGYFANRACYLCDINAKTLYEWLNIAAEEEGDGIAESESIYIRLSNAIKKAHAQSQARLVDTMMEAAIDKKNWLAAARTLESTDKENWWRTDKVIIDNSKKTTNITFVEVILDKGDGVPVIEGEYREIENGQEGADQVKSTALQGQEE